MVKKKSKNPDIIKKINDHADKKFNEISKLLNNKMEYTIKFNNDELILLNKDTKLLAGNFNFYGIITPDNRFLWAYMIPGINRNIIKNINKIKSFSHLFENSDNKIMMFYHQLLTQDSILVSNEEVDYINKILLYLSEDIYFFNAPNTLNATQILFLSKITEKYI